MSITLKKMSIWSYGLVYTGKIATCEISREIHTRRICLCTRVTVKARWPLVFKIDCLTCNPLSVILALNNVFLPNEHSRNDLSNLVKTKVTMRRQLDQACV